MKTTVRNNFKIITILLTLLVLYNEILIYHINEWPKMKCQNETSCTKILLVADLQLLGEKYDTNPFSFIFNWDCDRYLSKTYAVAMSYFKPDIVIFLGDIIDEGTIATEDEYDRYIKRLSMVTAPKNPSKYIWIPGDNDIGGEDEPIYENRVRLFKKVFKQSDQVSYRDINFYHFNKLLTETPELKKNHTVDHNKTNIVISHYPVLKDYQRVFALDKLHPSIIFSAHKHESLFVSKNKRKPHFSKIKAISPKDNEAIVLSYENEIHEISVPTCSYRMGAEDMGYGSAIIDTHHKSLRYSVLWSPRRFPVLRSYFIAVSFLVLYLFSLFVYLVICRRVFFHLSRRYSKLPI